MARTITCKCGCITTSQLSPREARLLELGILPLKCLRCGYLQPPYIPAGTVLPLEIAVKRPGSGIKFPSGLRVKNINRA